MARQPVITHMMANVAASCAAPIGQLRITNPNPGAMGALLTPQRDPEVTHIRTRITNEVNQNFYSEESIRMRLNMTAWGDTDIGRCDESAATAVGFCLKAIRETLSTTNVELLGTGHHAFVVAARDRNVDINNLAQWGDDAFVIDIWFALQYGTAAVFPDPRTWDYLIQQCSANRVYVCRGWAVSNSQPGRIYTWTPGVPTSWSIL